MLEAIHKKYRSRVPQPLRKVPWMEKHIFIP